MNHKWSTVSLTPWIREANSCSATVAYRGGFWGFKPPPPKFRNFDKLPKIKKILLYEMKFLIPNYSCLQNPWLGGHCPQTPVLSVLNWICWTPPNKIPGYATARLINNFPAFWKTWRFNALLRTACHILRVFGNISPVRMTYVVSWTSILIIFFICE
jgi:hypothetical protein